MACFHIFLTPVMVHHSGGFDLVAVTSTMYYILHKREGKATIAHIIYYGTSGGELKILEIFEFVVVGKPTFVWIPLF